MSGELSEDAAAHLYYSEPTTAETVLAAFPELRDTDYGRHLDMLDREAERGLARFYADMAVADAIAQSYVEGL